MHFSTWLCRRCGTLTKGKGSLEWPQFFCMTFCVSTFQLFPRVSFLIINEVWKTHWFCLIIHKLVSFPLPKSEGQQKGVKNFAGVTEVSCSQEIEEKEIVFWQAAAMFFTSVSQPCTNTFWKHPSEETPYQERFEVRINEENAFCGNLASVWTDQN